MPQSKCTPLNDKDWKLVADCFTEASKHGLQFEWLQWFAGGIAINKLSVREAAFEASLEWDLL